MVSKKYVDSALYHPVDDAEAAKNSELVVSRLIKVLEDEGFTYGQAVFHLEIAISRISHLSKSSLIGVVNS